VSHAKNQHYVSRLYLRQFAFEAGKNPHIYAFDKTTRRVIRPSIRNIAAEMHLYESSDTGIERALGMVEDNFVPAYRLIREIDDIAALGPSERAAIAIFIAVQQVRTVEFRETLKSMVAGLDEWARRHNHELDKSYTTITEEQCREDSSGVAGKHSSCDCDRGGANEMDQNPQSDGDAALDIRSSSHAV
jgi:hypothetical protein